MTENDFWGMTIAEIQRYFESRARIERLRAREKASYDYTLADAIGRSVARLYSSAAKMPDIAELYPSLFSADEVAENKQQKQAELSALRFRQFAAAHNKKLGGIKSE